MPMMSGGGWSDGNRGGGSAAMAAAAVLSGASLFLMGALSGYLLHSSCLARTNGAGGADTTGGDGEESECPSDDLGGHISPAPTAQAAASSSSYDDNREERGDGRPSGKGSTDATTVDGASAVAVAGGGRGGKDTSGGKVKKPGKGGDDGGGGARPIIMVVQRCRHARLLLHASSDGTDSTTDGELSGESSKARIATVGRHVDIGSPLPSLPSPSSSSDGDVGEEIPVPILPVGGMVVYVSFARTAKSGSMVTDAARTLLNLPILTRGRWGDGGNTGGGGSSAVMSALRMAAELDSERQRRGEGGGVASTGDEWTPSPGRTPTYKEEEGVAIVVVPQANLISKVKSGGKSVQYHDQIDKGTGAKLFNEFVDALTQLSQQHQLATRGDGEGDAGHGRSVPPKMAGSQQSAMAASVPPEHVLRDESKYSSWDDYGFPLTDVDGKPLTKSARKKLRKIHDAQRKRHAKYLLKQQQQQQQQPAAQKGNDDDDDGVPADPDPPGAPGDEGAKEPRRQLDPGFITIVRGTFGRRQGLEFCSDMGPFCHVLGIG